MAKPKTSQKIRSGDVAVTGVKEANAALRRVGPELRKEFKKATRDIAGTVAGDARSKAQGLGGVAAKVAPSIKPVSGGTQNATGAGVAFGGANYPMGPGAEFGSYRYKQFKPWRGSGPGAGYFVYPAIRDNSEYIFRSFDQAAQRLISREFPQ